jgi:magnesium transporter
MEDVLNTGQRPKIEPFEDQLFIVMSLPRLQGELVDIQQVGFFLNRGSLVSFHEGDFEPFQPIIKRLRDDSSRLRRRGVDFLLYSLIDVVIDQGFPVLELFGLQLAALEERILTASERDTPEKVHVLKRELILLRRMLWPQREVINQLLREENGMVREETLIYLRDCYDHSVQIMELLET